MKKSLAIFVFVLFSVLLLCACGHKKADLNDEAAMAELADYTIDGSIDLWGYLGKQEYLLISSEDHCYVFSGENGTIVIEETGAPAYDVYVGDGEGNNRQFGYPAANRIGEGDNIQYGTYRTTLGGYTTDLPAGVFAEVVRLVERQKGK